MLVLKTILTPVDFSSQTPSAVEHAAALARHFAAKVLLLHVPKLLSEWERNAMDLRTPGGAGPLEGESLAAARRQMQEVAATIGPGVEVETRVCPGDPPSTIVRVARDEQADLIVMPTHGYGPFRRFLLGSVTSKVLHDAECPVFTGAHIPEMRPGQTAPYQRIACAVDLGEHSEQVLRWAADLATACNAELAVFHAVPYSEFTGCDVTDFTYIDSKIALRPTAEFLRECWSKAIRIAESRLDELIERVGCSAERHVEDATVAAAARGIVERMRADLLVIGRSPGRGLGRLRTHAYALIRESPCSVVSV
jgi:nucleotide-binding universal stress UspA family protein